MDASYPPFVVCSELTVKTAENVKYELQMFTFPSACLGQENDQGKCDI